MKGLQEGLRRLQQHLAKALGAYALWEPPSNQDIVGYFPMSSCSKGILNSLFIALNNIYAKSVRQLPKQEDLFSLQSVNEN